MGVELHIYGAGNETEKIKKHIESNKKSNVFYHGLTTADEINRVLPNYNASLIPLVNPIYGAFPSKIFTAMASGVPVLFSGEGEGAHFVSKYRIGLVNSSSNIKQLESNILKLKSLSIDEYESIKNRALELMSSEFSYERNQQNLYNKLKQINV